MHRHFSRITTIVVLALACGSIAHAHQTIVFFRPGEKPSAGLGQLTCQGLNRAVALADVLIGKFGTPDYFQAPNPAVEISDPAGSQPIHLEGGLVSAKIGPPFAAALLWRGELAENKRTA